MQRRKTRSLSLWGILCAGLLVPIGCDAPSRVLLPQNDGLKRWIGVSNLDASSSLISVANDGGTVFTVDAQAHELRISNGTVMRLTAAQELQAVGAFIGIVNGDVMASQVPLATTPPYPGNPGDPWRPGLPGGGGPAAASLPADDLSFGVGVLALGAILFT